MAAAEEGYDESGEMKNNRMGRARQLSAARLG